MGQFFDPSLPKGIPGILFDIERPNLARYHREGKICRSWPLDCHIT